MAKAALVSADQDAGSKLIRALDAAQFPVQAALWLYSSEDGGWRFIIASSFVDERGKRQAYRRIQKELRGSKDHIELSLQDVSVISPTEDLIVSLRSAFRTEVRAILDFRVQGIVVDHVFIEDAIIYRLT